MKLCYEFDCTVVDVQMCIEDLFDKLAICMCPYIWNWSMSHTCRRSPYCTGKGVNHNRMTDSNWVSSSGGFTWSGDPRRASYHFTTQTHTSCYDGKESSLLQIFCWRSKSTIFANIGWSQDSKEKHNFYWNCLATTVFTYLLSMLLTMYTTYKLSLDFESAIWHEFDV